MASSIDATKPVSGSPTTQSVRDNFSAAKSEIEALQASTAAASTTSSGIVELATTAETQTGTDTARVPSVAAATASFLTKYAAVNVVPDTTDTLADADLGTDIVYTSASAVTVTVPGTLAVGFQCTITQAGAGTVTITSADNLNGSGSDISLSAIYSGVTLLQYAEGEWLVVGSIA